MVKQMSIGLKRGTVKVEPHQPDLKAKLAEQYPDDRKSYTRAKSSMINDILNKAGK